MPPHGLINDEDRQEELPEDNGTPFSAPEGVRDSIDNTHQKADGDIDTHEHYDEGISGATETDDPGFRGILDYHGQQED